MSILAFLPNFGAQEGIIIFLVLLLLFGAKKIPELARGLGKSMGEFKKAREEFEGEVQRAADDVALEEEKSSEDSPAATKASNS